MPEDTIRRVADGFFSGGFKIVCHVKRLAVETAEQSRRKVVTVSLMPQRATP